MIAPSAALQAAYGVPAASWLSGPRRAALQLSRRVPEEPAAEGESVETQSSIGRQVRGQNTPHALAQRAGESGSRPEYILAWRC